MDTAQSNAMTPAERQAARRQRQEVAMEKLVTTNGHLVASLDETRQKLDAANAALVAAAGRIKDLEHALEIAKIKAKAAVRA